jgi:nitrile hydratase accessory protein
MSTCATVPIEAPPFSEPWHAQAFALTVHLNARGAYSWPQWAERFGSELSTRRRARGALDGGADYWEAWLGALEGLLAEQGLAEPGAVEALRHAWAEAYLHTPHGAPVRLTSR